MQPAPCQFRFRPQRGKREGRRPGVARGLEETDDEVLRPFRPLDRHDLDRVVREDDERPRTLSRPGREIGEDHRRFVLRQGFAVDRREPLSRRASVDPEPEDPLALVDPGDESVLGHRHGRAAGIGGMQPVFHAGTNELTLFGTDTLLYGGISAISGTITAVPEPEAYGMMLAGLGLIGWMARRRKQLNPG